MEQKKVAAIESVTLNTATYSNISFNPTYINFFFGKNGAGKTSLGRELKEGSAIHWADGENPADYEILLYNQDFIDEHFHTLDRLQGVFSLSTGKETEEAEKKIKDLTEENKQLEKRLKEITDRGGEREKITTGLQTAEANFQNACLRNTKELRDKYKQAFKGATRNPQLAQRINTTAPREVKESDLDKIFPTAFDENARIYPYLTEIDGEEHIAAIPTCDLLSEEIISKGNTVYASFVSELRSLDWIEEGHKRFHESSNGTCPYCAQPLPGNFETLLASCYDDEYQAKIEAIKQFQNRYMTHMNTIWTIIEHNQKAETLPSVKEHLELAKPHIENFLRAMRGVITRIDDKLKNPSAPVVLEDLTPLLLDINYQFHQANIRISHNNEVVDKLAETQKQCTDDVWALAAYKMAGEVETFHLAQKEARDAATKLDAESTALKNRIGEIRRELDVLGKTSTTVQAAIDAINRLLCDSGFEGFEIEKSDMAPNAYKVVRKDKEKSIAMRLSDGERHFLSFLYFYNLVKGCEENGVMKEKIVIIDDPVSSLDGNALFIISALVREMIEVCYNNTDYRDQRVKGDFIKQIFILTHNAQFHRGITYNQVNRFKCVNFYKINKIDNLSSITPCLRPSRNEAGEFENYNPVKNAYAALWTEYQELNNEIPLMNVIHRILDFYFLDMCGKDGLSIRDEILVDNRDKFIGKKPDGTPDMSLFNLADSMLQYMGAGVDGDLTLISDGADVDQIRSTFEMIFERLGQKEHYQMMIERSRDAVAPKQKEEAAAKKVQ